MNLLLLDPAELDADGGATIADARARHLIEVLRVERGRRVRAGLLGGPFGEAEVVAVERAAGRVRVRPHWRGAPPARPPRDLWLAMPRPKALKRLWAPLAAAGVARIVILNAARVERMYFDSDALDAVLVRARLIEGLAQAGDTRLPEVSVRRRFRPFIEDELTAAPAPGERRLVAQPGAGPRVAERVRPGEHVTLAVGPERGWTDFELELLERRGFERVSMGPRVLRSEHAVLALLALVADAQRASVDADAASAHNGARG